MKIKYILILLMSQIIQSTHAQLDSGVVCTQAGLTVTQSECEALVTFYNTAVNPSWPLANTWGSADINSWAGVGEGAGHVVSLDMPATSLAGTLPLDWVDLNQLGFIRIQGSGLLTGGLPANFADLTLLESLTIAGTGLSGNIPPQLGLLNNLTDINLVNNNFSGAIPSELGDLANLEFLFLEDNQLSGNIPSSLGNLNNLEELYLSRNQLTGAIPDSIGNLINLEELYLDRNAISGSIPASLGNLSNLVELRLTENQLTGTFPDSFVNLSSLSALFAEMNCLDADANNIAIIPSALIAWSQGVSLFLNDQCIVGVNNPPAISGSPDTVVVVGDSYIFTPTASDPDVGDTLTFNIINQPTWAAFNGNDGSLSGTPSTTDIGVNSNIIISVSDGTDEATLPEFSITVQAGGVPPTTNSVPTLSFWALTVLCFLLLLGSLTFIRKHHL